MRRSVFPFIFCTYEIQRGVVTCLGVINLLALCIYVTSKTIDFGSDTVVKKISRKHLRASCSGIGSNGESLKKGSLRMELITR